MSLFDTKLYQGPKADPRDCDYCGKPWPLPQDKRHLNPNGTINWEYMWIAEGQCGQCASWVLARRKRRKQIAAATALGCVALGAAWWVGRHLTWRTL